MDLNPVPTDRQMEGRTERTPKQDRRGWWSTLFALCGILGAMLGLSVRTQTAKQQQDKLDRLQGSAVQFNANLDLQRRIRQLQKDNVQLVKSAPSDTERLKVLSKDLANAQAFAGLTDVKGPGIVVTLSDSKKPFANMPAGFSNMPTGFAPPNIIHDTDIDAVLNELKASGAEAISVNGQRIAAVSPVRCVGPTVLVNFTPTASPFVIKAIGDPKTLKAGVELPGGIVTQIRGYDPNMFIVQAAKQSLVIPAYSGGEIEPKFARPVGQSAEAGKKLGE